MSSKKTKSKTKPKMKLHRWSDIRNRKSKNKVSPKKGKKRGRKPIPGLTAVSLRLHKDDIRMAKAIAKAKKTAYQILVREWVAQAVATDLMNIAKMSKKPAKKKPAKKTVKAATSKTSKKTVKAKPAVKPKPKAKPSKPVKPAKTKEKVKNGVDQVEGLQNENKKMPDLSNALETDDNYID